MQPPEARRAFKRTSRTGAVTRDQLIELLEESTALEYRAVLADIGARQCDSLANFAMAEHLRSLLATREHGV